MNMVERAPTPEDPEPEIANLALDDVVQPSNPASAVLFKEVLKEAHQQLRVLLHRSLQVLSTCGKRFEASTSDDVPTEIDYTTTKEKKPPVYGAHIGSKVDGSQQPPVPSRCINRESDTREDSVSFARVDMGTNQVRDARDDVWPQGKQRPRSMHMSDDADFMDLGDPFACHMVGSPRVVKNLESVLPPTHRSTNKVVEARRRFRRTVQCPQSAGKRPGSAGRPGSANGGRVRRQVGLRVAAPAQTATSRGARSGPRTPKKLPTPRSTQLRSSSLCEGAPTCTNLSEESQLSGFTSTLSALSIAQQRTNSRSLRAAPHHSSVRIVPFSHRPKRTHIASSSRPVPLRPATPKRRLAHAPLSPPTFPAARPFRDHRKSFVIKQSIPFMLSSAAPVSTASRPVFLPLAHSKI